MFFFSILDIMLWPDSNKIPVSCSQWGVLPAADDQWQSTFRPGCILLYDRRDRQHHFWIHPQKQRESLNYLSNNSNTSIFLAAYTGVQLLNWFFFWILSQQDIFAVAVSLNTGRIVYISDQAASILNCKRDVFKNTKFVEFLTPQDVSVFYSFTTPYRLPSWSMYTGAGTYTSLQTQCYNYTRSVMIIVIKEDDWDMGRSFTTSRSILHEGCNYWLC